MPVAASFQESDLLDIYDSGADGTWNLSTQIRNCAGTCKDTVEMVVRRGADALIVRSISTSSFYRLRRAGVTVYIADDGPASNSLDSLKNNVLKERSR